jgi:2-dehydro-3-deoxygluconokinase
MMDVATLGETMVLFSPETTGLMRYARDFSAKVAGAESNVAVGLSRLGHQVGWISRLGNDEFGKMIFSFIRGEGVDVSGVQFDSKAPTGLYFKEKLSPGEFRVNYYRKDSAASRMTRDDVNEKTISNAKYLHITGITPALSESCRDTVMKAIETAKKHNVKVVFDPNLRKKLWSKQQAKETLLEIAAKVDIVLPGIDEGEFLFGNADPETLAEKFRENGAANVIIKLGAKGAYYLSSSGKGLVDGFLVENVVDPVGAGDGFAAGFLSGLLDEFSLKDAVKRGNAVGAMVTMVSGDVEGLPEKDRLMTFMQGFAGEDVSR